MKLTPSERSMTLRALGQPLEGYVKVGRDRERQLIAEAEREAERTALSGKVCAVQQYGAWRASVRERLNGSRQD